jgi:hypothetical protein
LAGAKRFNALACGRRWGKSKLGIDRAVGPALAGHPVGWFAPTYKILDPAWEELRTLLRPITLRSDATKRLMQLATGGVVEMWSLEDKDAGRSRKYKRVIVDEAAMVPALDRAWNEAIRPTLTDLRGDAWFLSTPKGQNFFWTLFLRGKDPNEPSYASWKMPTTANPYIDPAEVEEARRNIPERSFSQEYLAEFIEDGGGVFRGVRAVVDFGRRDNEAASGGGSYSLGVDLARVEDFTVLTVLDAKGRQVYHERFNQIAWERQIAAIVRVALAYRATVLLDSTGVGDPIFEALRKQNVAVQGYQFTNQSKEQLIDALALAIEQGEVRLMDVPEQTAELQAYQYELTPSRNVRMNAPEGMHDDCVIGLALANWVRGHYRTGNAAVGGARPVRADVQQVLQRQAGMPGRPPGLPGRR